MRTLQGWEHFHCEIITTVLPVTYPQRHNQMVCHNMKQLGAVTPIIPVTPAHSGSLLENHLLLISCLLPFSVFRFIYFYDS